MGFWIYLELITETLDIHTRNQPEKDLCTICDAGGEHSRARTPGLGKLVNVVEDHAHV
jgi:hypothetical protein